MLNFFAKLFKTDFMPHVYCLREPGVVWLQVISDCLIAAAYFLIPYSLLLLVWRRRDLAFRWAFVLFGVFILACGSTHLLNVWTLWHPVYRFEGLVKAVTAIASLGTAVVLFRLIPEAVALPSPAQLRLEMTERYLAERQVDRLKAKLEQEQRDRAQEIVLRESKERLDLIAELEQSNRKLAEAQTRLQEVLDAATQVAIIATDTDGLITMFNSGAERMLQYKASEMVGINTPRLIHLDSECAERSRALALELGRPLVGFDIFTEPVRLKRYDEREWKFVRKDQSVLDVNVSTTAVHNTEGRITGFLKVASDISARKALESELRQQNSNLERHVRERTQRLEKALGEKTVLLKEVHHRVKNNLAVIASLLGMQADSVSDETSVRLLLESQQRVYSMGLIHEHLYNSGNLERVRFDEYARKLANELYFAFSSPAGVSVQVDGEPIEVPIDTAIPCGLILNELLANCFKYAFPNGKTGTILVEFKKGRPGCVNLSVTDDGVGLRPDFAWQHAQSLGLQIVQILAKQLGGALELQDSCGTRFYLSFPCAENICVVESQQPRETTAPKLGDLLVA